MTGTKYRLEILHQCGKSVKTKSQKVLGVNSDVCRSYTGECRREGHFVNVKDTRRLN